MESNPLKRPSDLVGEEIIAYLNSGKYISGTTRRMLEEKLEREKRTNKYGGSYSSSNTSSNTNSNERSTSSGSSNFNRFRFLNQIEPPKKIEPVKKIKTEEFPTLGSKPDINEKKKVSPLTDRKPFLPLIYNKECKPIPIKTDTLTTESNVQPIIQPVIQPDIIQPSIDYGILIKKNTDWVPDVVTNELFVGDKFVLPFRHIKEMYDYYAIYRIRLQYLILNRKIHLLDSICYVNVNRGTKLKQQFGYHKLVEEEAELRRCLSLYLILNQIMHFFEALTELLTECQKKLDNDMPIKCDHIHKILVDTKKQCQGITLIPKMIDENDKEHLVEINAYLKFVRDIINNILKLNKDTIKTFLLETTNNCAKLQSLIDKIVNIHDPHIECDYCVLMNKDIEKPIIPCGLATFMYLGCDKEIDLSTNNKAMYDIVLQSITGEQLNNIFRKSKIGSDDNIIRVKIMDTSQYINISFKIGDIEIPVATATINITGLPPNAHVFSSMLINTNLSPQVSLPNILIPNMYDLWLHTRVSSNIGYNKKYTLPKEEYEDLDYELQQEYSYDDTTKNVFHVDYLFNELLKSDEKNTYIKPDMIESFEQLVKHTSMIK